MYLTPRFHEQDLPRLLKLIREYPLATVITRGPDGKPCVNHLPVLAETRAAGELVLVGHLARASPQWKHLSGGEALVVFNGPNTYVTPRWYKDPMNVPTWNYAVVHAEGRATLVESFEGIEGILRRSVEAFESGDAEPWTYDLPREFREELVRAIVGFEIRVERIDGKFKLSQNRAPEDYQGVLEGLRERQDDMSRRVLELMTAEPLG